LTLPSLMHRKKSGGQCSFIVCGRPQALTQNISLA
jgi:hypothetical protein